MVRLEMASRKVPSGAECGSGTDNDWRHTTNYRRSGVQPTVRAVEVQASEFLEHFTE